LVLRIEKRYQDNILSDSVVTFTTEGLLGQRYVNIRRGLKGSPIPAPGEIAAVPTQELKLKDFIDSLPKKAECSDAQIPLVKDKLQTH